MNETLTGKESSEEIKRTIIKNLDDCVTEIERNRIRKAVVAHRDGIQKAIDLRKPRIYELLNGQLFACNDILNMIDGKDGE